MPADSGPLRPQTLAAEWRRLALGLFMPTVQQIAVTEQLLQLPPGGLLSADATAPSVSTDVRSG